MARRYPRRRPFIGIGRNPRTGICRRYILWIGTWKTKCNYT